MNMIKLHRVALAVILGLLLTVPTWASEEGEAEEEIKASVAAAEKKAEGWSKPHEEKTSEWSKPHTEKTSEMKGKKTK